MLEIFVSKKRPNQRIECARDNTPRHVALSNTGQYQHLASFEDFEEMKEFALSLSEQQFYAVVRDDHDPKEPGVTVVEVSGLTEETKNPIWEYVLNYLDQFTIVEVGTKYKDIAATARSIYFGGAELLVFPEDLS